MYYTNSTRSDVAEVRVIDLMPAALGYLECSGGITCTRQGRRVSWFLGDLASGASGRVHLAMRVPEAAPAGAVITNTAWITAPSQLSPVFGQAVSRVVTGPTATATLPSTEMPTVPPTDAPTTPPTGVPTVVPTEPPTSPPSATPTEEPGARALLPVAHRW
jgi:hypothetical protein